MGERGPRIAVLLFIALVLGGVAWWQPRFEKVTEVVDHGMSELARQRPLLGAQRVLERRGLSVRSVTGLSSLETLPDTDTALILLGPHHHLSERRRDALLDWVAAGGRLVLEAPVATDDADAPADPLLDALGVTVKACGCDEPEHTAHTLNKPWIETEDADDTAVPDERHDEGLAGHFGRMSREGHYREGNICRLYPATTRARADGNRLDWRIFQRGRRVFADTESVGRVLAYDRLGTRAITVPRGQGRVHVFATLELWDNYALPCHDHALLLWQLLGDKKAVRILDNAEAPPLWALLWQHAPAAVLGLGLWLSLGLWRRMIRLGPVRRVRHDSRRSFIEHIVAGARFAWDRDGGRSLRDALRQTITQRATRRHPGFRTLAPERQAALLARWTELDAAAVRDAWAGPPSRGAPAFEARIRLLQTVRKHL